MGVEIRTFEVVLRVIEYIRYDENGNLLDSGELFATQKPCMNIDLINHPADLKGAVTALYERAFDNATHSMNWSNMKEMMRQKEAVLEQLESDKIAKEAEGQPKPPQTQG